MGKVDLSPLYRSSIGFDHLGSLLDSALRADHREREYPPCNIEVIGENRYRISLAVPGYQRHELDVQTSEGMLIVRGKRQAEGADESRYVHQGIHYHPFERRFSLADFVEARGARLHDGLLEIELVREVPEKLKPRQIQVEAANNDANPASTKTLETEKEVSS